MNQPTDNAGHAVILKKGQRACFIFQHVQGQREAWLIPEGISLEKAWQWAHNHHPHPQSIFFLPLRDIDPGA